MPLALQDVEGRATALRRDAGHVLFRHPAEPGTEAVLVVATVSEHPALHSIESAA